MNQGPRTRAYDAERIEPGTILTDRYAVEEAVGYGGMSTVFRGRDQLLDRDVAIKVMNARLGALDADRAAFLREARAAASLSHPGIVSTYDAGIFNGWPFIVMEFVPGGSLKVIIDGRTPLEPAQVVAIGVVIAEALQYGHERGLVHCDVKPQNVLLDSGGRPKLVDFGISQSLATTAALTATVSGTAAYVAPEQLEGIPLDGRADIYSLGTVLYEALSRSLPFAAPNLAALATRRLVADPRPLSVVNPGVPPALAAIVMRCLQRDRAHRYRSAGELAAALRGAAGGSPGPAAPPAASGPSRGGVTQVWQRADLETARSARKSGSGLFWALLIIFLALLMGLVVALAVVITGRANAGAAQVPQVQSARLDDAARTLQSAGFTVAVVEQHANQPIGTVLNQTPAPGVSLARGDQVTVTISIGP